MKKETPLFIFLPVSLMHLQVVVGLDHWTKSFTIVSVIYQDEKLESHKLCWSTHSSQFICMAAVYVGKLKREERPDHFNDELMKTLKDGRDPKYPENYQTCITFFRMVWSMVQVLGVWFILDELILMSNLQSIEFTMSIIVYFACSYQ